LFPQRFELRQPAFAGFAAKRRPAVAVPGVGGQIPAPRPEEISRNGSLFFYCRVINKKVLDELIGWYGTVAIVLAYALVSFGWLSSSTLLYQILNGTGALGMVYISFKKRAYQPGVLNVIWAIIALIAIVNLMI